MILLTCKFIIMIMGRVAAQIVSHTTDTDIKLANYFAKFTWHDGRYARAQMDRGGADAWGGTEADL